MHDVIIGTQAKRVASTWDELSPKQVLALVPVLYGTYPNPLRQRFDALRILLGISQSLLLRFTPVQLVEVKWLVEFLFDAPCTLTRQLLPRVRGGPWYRRWVYGPTAGLANLRFLEFVFADSFFVAYCRTSEAPWLDQLLAVLYRPQRWLYRPHAVSYQGDRRQDFNENLLARHAGELARLPQPTKLAILTWYRGCRHALEQSYPLVFAAPEAGTGAAEAGDWGRVLRELSGQAFGDFEATGRQHLHTVLAKMQDDLHRAQTLQPPPTA